MSEDVQRVTRSERLAEAERVLARTLSRAAARRELAAMWGISERQARRYVEAVRKRWEIEAKQDRKLSRAVVRQAYVDTYNEARTAGDRKHALMALRGLRELEGLDAPDQHDLYFRTGGPVLDVQQVDHARQKLKLLKSGGDEE